MTTAVREENPVLLRILEGLTPDQTAAVTHGEGALLIVAGAGTGKTTVITRRIAHLVAAKRARPSEILALTFTDKAAEEMEARVDLLVPYGFADMWISTFHAFGDRVLRGEGLALGLSTDFRVLTRPEQIVFLRENLFALPLQRLRPLGDPTKHLQALVTLFSRAKDEAVTPEEYLAFAAELADRAKGAPEDAAPREEAALQQELAACYGEYQRLLGERGLVDFGDQVLLCLRLFREHPLILEKYRERFRYILVDEFQDTNHTQWELVKLLAGRERNITVVGDDDQSIYKFRGAAISNILGFTAAYPEARRIVLRENFRSSQVVLDAAYRLIRHNDPDRLEVREKIDKRLVATAPEGSTPRHLHHDTVSSEADAVARLIAGRVEAGAWAYRDVAVLVRANRDADPFLRAMNLQGIPWRFSGNQGLYARPEVRLLLAFLRVVADPEDTVSLYYLAGSELYEMDDWQLARCAGAARRAHRSLRWILENLDGVAELQDVDVATRATAEHLLKDLKEYVSLSRDRSAGEVLYQFLMRSGLLKRLTAAGSPAADVRVGNIARFFEIVHRFADVASPEAGVPQFIRHLDLLLEGGDDPAAVEADEDAEAVNVLTVHKAKGLEFPVVFLVSLVADRFPSRGRREPLPLPDGLLHDVLASGDFHLQEERRLFYVGMTRAKRELFFTSARDYGGARAKKVSRFVLEALDLPPSEPKPYKASALETIQRHAPSVEEEPDALRVIPEGEILSLSHYQVDDYLTCPLKYKYIHVLRVPIREHHSVVYGKALHEAISLYLRRKLAQARGDTTPGGAVTEAEVLAAFEEVWQSVGFLSREHEDLRLEEGRAVLRRFLAEEERTGIIPTVVEQPFTFLLGTTKVVGRFDRVDERDGRVAIIDYKSSAVRDQREADRKAKESLQLAIYALAYAEMHGRIPDAAVLHFLESGLVGSARKSEADLTETRTTIGEVARGIRARTFTATPGYLQCSYCAFREICPSTAYSESE
ncbi:MAG: ATP-dependent DNA helicase [Candidatus Methylomirabilota bacterium]|jgi:DNA helicase-2/ATP-dependent DNA helicase PcrA